VIKVLQVAKFVDYQVCLQVRGQKDDAVVEVEIA